MHPVDWGQAFRIVGGGLLAVFFIMSILALTTHYIGKIFMGVNRRKEEAAKAAEAAAEKGAAK